MNICKDSNKLKHQSRRTLVRTAQNIHAENMNLVENIFQKNDYVSTTADIWTIKSRRILGVTVNWVC